MAYDDDLRRLEPFIGRERAHQWLLAWQLADADRRRYLELAVQNQLEKRLGVDPLQPDRSLSLPQKQEAAGEFHFGTVVGGRTEYYPFGLRKDEFIQHVAIFGRSGAGKTNTIALMIKELVRHQKPFMIFDWKQNYRDLIAAPNHVPLEIYTVGRDVHPVRFNPLIPPPGTDLTVWLKKLIEIISSAYYLGEGVMYMLQQALDQVYTEHGSYADGEVNYPTMKDVLQTLEETPVKGRKAMWLDSTLRAVQSLCFGQISDVINVSRNDSIEHLLNQNVCLELNSLAHAEKVFFIETLMVWIHHYRMCQPDREQFKHCLIIEEAHNILGADKKETVIDLLLREIRELGEGIVLVDQHPSQISVPALGNTYTTIALNLKHAKDISTLSEIMQIARDDRHLLGQLPMGRAVVKLQSRYQHPFQIQIPKIAITKGGVTDTDLRQRYPPDSTDSTAEMSEPSDSSKAEPIPSTRKEQEASAESPLPALEEALLKDIRKHPYDGVVKRYHRLGVSRRRGNHAKEALITKGVIQPVDIPTASGKVVLLDLTDQMKEACRRNGVPMPSPREGGLAHGYWKAFIGRLLTKDGWKVTLEKALGEGQCVDIDAKKDSCQIAVEIETGSRGVGNIRKLQPHAYDWILSFGVDSAVNERTRKGMKELHIHMNNVLLTSPATLERHIRMVGGQVDTE